MSVKYLRKMELISLLRQICINEDLRYFSDGIVLRKFSDYKKYRGSEWLTFEDLFPLKFDIYVMNSCKIFFSFLVFNEDKEKYIERRRCAYLYKNGQLTLTYKRG